MMTKLNLIEAIQFRTDNCDCSCRTHPSIICNHERAGVRIVMKEGRHTIADIGKKDFWICNPNVCPLNKRMNRNNANSEA